MKTTLLSMWLISGVLSMGVAAASPISLDLTTAGATGSIGAAKYTQVTVQPAGSGVLGSFVTIQTNNPTERAYNTTVNGVYDNGSSDIFNHQITVGQIGLITTGSDTVMRFLLDINQADSQRDNTKSRLNLDEVQIYLSRTPNQSVQPGLPNLGDRLFNTLTEFLVYQMDSTTDNNHVILDSDLQPGSGKADMYLDIPLASLNAAFAAGGFNTVADKNSAYIYLYSSFGSAPNDNTGGFEEWAAVKGNAIGEEPCNPLQQVCTPQEVPEPGSLSLVALGLLGAAVLFRRRGDV